MNSSVTVVEIPDHPYKGECQLKMDCHKTATHYVGEPSRGRQACPQHAAQLMVDEKSWERQLDFERKIDEARDYATNWEVDDDDT